MAVDQRSVSDSVAQQPCLLVFFVILSPKISSGANIISTKMYEPGNRRVSVKTGCVADWTPLCSEFIVTLLHFQGVCGC